MIDRLIKLLSVLSSIFTLLFIVLLYAMYQGFEPGPFLRGELNQVNTVSTEAPPKATTTKKVPDVLPVKATSTIGAPKPSSTTTVEAPLATKASSPVVKKPAKTNPTVLTPAPLRVEKPEASKSVAASSTAQVSSSEPGVPKSDGALNQKDILDILNQERAKEGLAALGFNIRLSAMAEGKAVDMINKQYFAHMSPTGVDVTKLAKTYNYEYIFLGENLAMGDFVSSSDVMTGWMNSPGHRANILNKNYTEVGISALQGSYNGRVVWYAVQEFGKPLSLCPSPNNALEAKVLTEEQQVSALEESLKILRTNIEQSSGSQSEYNALVEEYNALVDKYNTLVAATKADIVTFNASVNAFNRCIGANATSTPSVE